MQHAFNSGGCERCGSAVMRMNGRGGGSTEVENKAIARLRRTVGEKKTGPLGLDLMGAAVARIAGWTDREAALLEEGMRLVGRDFRHLPAHPPTLQTQSGLLLTGLHLRQCIPWPCPALNCTTLGLLSIARLSIQRLPFKTRVQSNRKVHRTGPSRGRRGHEDVCYPCSCPKC